jgi:peptidoglycan/LPS O-acetylase OafA/YrhL
MTTEPAASYRPADRPSAARLAILDLLRGLAALAVCLYHFTDPRDGLFVASDPLRRMTWQGWLGVEVFFVISGFVIPYSMHVRSYRLRDAGGFLVRRLKRLEPPYLACIVLILLLNGLWNIIPAMSEMSREVTLPQLLAHVGYLIEILKDISPRWDYDWLNPVFWTLAIEFQFYIFMAIVFPLLVHERMVVRLASVATIALAGFAAPSNLSLLPHWLPLFALGIVTFQSYAGKVSPIWYVALVIGLTALSWQIVGARQTAGQTAVGLATALSIRVFTTAQIPRILTPLLWLGTISYSFYLLHIPIGEALIHFLARHEGAHSQRYLMTAAAIVTSVGAAWLFWYAVERRSQVWARRTRLPHDGGTSAK